MIAVHFLPPRDGAWSLAVYSIAGRRVRQLDRGIGGSGRQCRIWDGRDSAGRPAPSGVYFYALTQNRRLLDVAKEILLP
jgi:flagellar hook assembly protein FlgD